MDDKGSSQVSQNGTNGIVLQVTNLSKGMENKSSSSKCNQCGIARSTTNLQDIIKESQSSYIRMFAAETLATGLQLFLGCMGCILGVADDQAPPHHLTAFTFGMVILLLIQALGHISGAHMNPAVTISAYLMKQLSASMAVVYIAAQFIGAVLGMYLLKLLIPNKHFANGLCMTLPDKLMNETQVFAIEVIVTAVLIFVVCGTWDARNAGKDDSLPIRFAFVVVALSIVAGPFTGCSMNTARTFGPALVSGNFQYQWIYWIAPNLGALVGCGIYQFVFALPDKNNCSEEEKMSLHSVRHEKS